MRYDEISPIPPLTKTTKALIISCSAIYFVDMVLSQLGFRPGGLTIDELFGLVPGLIVEQGWVWQFVTYLFLHGHPFHLLMNMAILWYFGAELEMRMGVRRFCLFYFLCGIGAGIFNFAINIAFFDAASLMTPIIGASGAIYGLLAAYGIFYADRIFLLLFLFPVKARYFVLIIAGVELTMGLQQGASRDNVAHFAHLGGMLVGAAYVWFTYLRPRGGSGSGGKRDWERERLKKKFTLIVNEGSEGAPAAEKEDGGPNYWN